MSRINIRRLESPRFDAGNVVPYQVRSGFVLYALQFTLTGAITATAANNTRPATRRGDEWGLIRRLQLKVNEEERVNLSGDELWWLNRHWFNKTPQVSNQLSNTAVANPAFNSTLILPFFMPRSFRPQDTLLDTSRFESVQLDITWGSHLDINNLATGFTTAPVLRVQAIEDTGRRGGDFWSRYLLRRETDPPGANANWAHDLAVDRTYRRLWINTRNASAVDVGTIINSMKVYSGGINFFEAPFADARETFDLLHGAPDNFVRGNATNPGIYEPLRQNDFNAIDGWATIDFALDGQLTSAPDTYGFSKFTLEADVAAAGKIITIEETVKVPRAA